MHWNCTPAVPWNCVLGLFTCHVHEHVCSNILRCACICSEVKQMYARHGLSVFVMHLHVVRACRQRSDVAMKCVECSYSTFYPIDLEKHVLRRHAKRKFSCDLCKSTFALRYSRKTVFYMYTHPTRVLMWDSALNTPGIGTYVRPCATQARLVVNISLTKLNPCYLL